MNTKTLFVLLLCLVLAAGCSTVTAVKSGTASWQQIAIASCTDLQTAATAGSAATAWAKLYFPNQENVFVNVIEPVLADVVAGVDAYCSAASLVQDVTGVQSLLTKQAEILALVKKLQAFIAAVKTGGVVKQ